MPVEKLRLRPWLENALDSGQIPGVKWIDAREKIFQVSWKHASRQGWSLDTDACIFKAWAVHTGRFRLHSDDKPDPRRWKANFRCALNALPDIKELQARGVTRGNNAFKVYQMLTKTVENTKIKKDGTDTKGYQSKAMTVPKHQKPMVSNATSVIKRHSVIHKSSTVIQDTKSRRTICTSHPVNPQTLFPYWSPYAYSPYPHMKDHDYLTTWYDPKPEMKDIGVMTYQDIKKEPITLDEECCQQDDIVADTDEHYINNVKEEEEIPSDQEIIELVDRLSRDSDTSSNDSCSAFDEFDDEQEHDEGSRTKTLITLQPIMQPDEYIMTYGYKPCHQRTTAILRGFASHVNQ